MNFFIFVLVPHVLVSMLDSSLAKEEPPHIIYILADDMGWNDVSYHGSPEIPTPNIDALAASGIVLQNYYSAPMCSPSRGALMTGKYPFRIGLQHYVILTGSPNALPLNEKILPQHLKNLGYSTHGIGKWHLGFYKKEYTPTYRGFDTYFGFWNAKIDYYDYTTYSTVKDVPGVTTLFGIDLHNGTETVRNMRGQYATDTFTDAAVDVIKNHNKTKPLFLFLSQVACHGGNDYQMLQAPYEHVSKFDYIEDMDRRTYAGIVSKLDESVGRVFEALHYKGMLQNSIVIFASDNGGDPNGPQGERSNNWPLRSVKASLWEGGVRVPAIIWSPLFNLRKPTVFSQLMHISDWLPTLYRAGGGKPEDLGKIDGIDMWDSLLNNRPSSRHEILLNIDSMDRVAAVIQGHYKLIWGLHPDGKNFWYGASGHEQVQVDSMDEWVWRNGSVIKDLLQKLDLWLMNKSDEWRKNLVLKCGHCHDSKFEYCDSKEPCLYDLAKDPCEYENIASLHTEQVKSMMKRIELYNSTAVPAIFAPVDPRSDPRCHGFAYVPWLDEDYKSDCPYFSIKKD